MYRIDRCLSRQRLNSVSTREVALIERRLSNWCVTTKSTQDVEVSVVVTINSAISIAILKATTTKIMMKLFHKKNASFITKKKKKNKIKCYLRELGHVSTDRLSSTNGILDASLKCYSRFDEDDLKWCRNFKDMKTKMIYLLFVQGHRSPEQICLHLPNKPTK